MGYQVELETSAAKSLAKLPQAIRTRISQPIDRIADNPRDGAVKMAGGFGWRIRQGDYRIVFTIDDGAEVVTVTRIAHRQGVYRGM